MGGAPYLCISSAVHKSLTRHKPEEEEKVVKTLKNYLSDGD